MHWDPLIKLLHILAVIVAVGGLFARHLLRRYAHRASDIHVLSEFSNAAGQVERFMVIPGMNAVFVIGAVLALVGGMPIFGFLQGASQNWLLVSNLLLVGMVLVVPTIFLPRGKLFEAALQDAVDQGRVTQQLTASFNDPVVRLAHRWEEISLLAIIILMIAKPF